METLLRKLQVEPEWDEEDPITESPTPSAPTPVTERTPQPTAIVITNNTTTIEVLIPPSGHLNISSINEDLVLNVTTFSYYLLLVILVIITCVRGRRYRNYNIAPH